MAIDYALQYLCEVRKTVPALQLGSMVKHKGQVDAAIEAVRRQQPSLDLNTIINEWQMGMMVKTPDGLSKQVPVKIAQVLALVAPLENLKGSCDKCPANPARHAFGCFGAIQYPITKEAEEWLLSRLPDDADSPGLKLLFKFVADLEIDGAQVDAQRNRPEVFELSNPVVRTWGRWPSRQKLSSSQLIYLLAFGGDIGPEQAGLYTQLFGLDGLLAQAGDASSNCIAQFRQFMHTISLAGKLNAQLSVDA